MRHFPRTAIECHACYGQGVGQLGRCYACHGTGMVAVEDEDEAFCAEKAWEEKRDNRLMGDDSAASY